MSCDNQAEGAEAGVPPLPATVLVTSPAALWAKSDPNPAAAGRVTGPEI